MLKLKGSPLGGVYTLDSGTQNAQRFPCFPIRLRSCLFPVNTWTQMLLICHCFHMNVSCAGRVSHIWSLHQQLLILHETQNMLFVKTQAELIWADFVWYLISLRCCHVRLEVLLYYQPASACDESAAGSFPLSHPIIQSKFNNNDEDYDYNNNMAKEWSNANR